MLLSLFWLVLKNVLVVSIYIYIYISQNNILIIKTLLERGPDAVVKVVCLESRKSRARTPLWPSSFTHNDSILWEPSVTERYDDQPGIEYRIMCLEGSVISFIPEFSRGSPGPV